MVIRQLHNEQGFVHWMDGRLPPKGSMLSRTPMKKLVGAGFDRRELAENAFYKHSNRRSLNRYDYFMDFMEIFLEKDPPAEPPSGYAAFLLDPFAGDGREESLAGQMRAVKLYHKNRKNYRSLVVLSNSNQAARTQARIAGALGIIGFVHSRPEGFEDYDRFCRRLDGFLSGLTECAGSPYAVESYAISEGLVTQCVRPCGSDSFDQT